MGKLVEGVWHDVWYQTEKHNGRYERQDSLFRNWVTTDGSAGPSGEIAIKQKPDDITYTYLWPVAGHIEQLLCGS